MRYYDDFQRGRVNVVGNGVVVGCGGGGWEIKKVLLYARLEPYTKVQV